MNSSAATTELGWGAPAADVAVAAAGPTLKQRDFRQLRLQLYSLLCLIDGLLLAAAYLAADLLRFGALEGYGLNTFLVIFPIYIAVGLNGSAWSVEALASPRRSAAASVQALLFSLAVATILFFTLKIGEDFSRLVFGIGTFFALPMVAAGRLLLSERFGRRFGWRFRDEILLLDGVEVEAAGTERVVDAAIEEIRPACDDPAMLDRIGRLLGEGERVVIACAPERRRDWSRMLAGANVEVELLTPELDAIGALGLRRHGTVPTLLVAHGPLPLHARAIKRLFDLTVSSIALLLLAPLLALIAMAIRLESPGPILFRQSRLGRGNRLFEMIKFRSMHAEAADRDGSRSASRGDDRVTRVGGFLRRTSLDELPQLINVLRGDMSIVGPRPHPLGCRAENELFWTIDTRYFDRHAIRPGITGLAQVRGHRGATSRREDLTERLQSDLEYVQGWHIGRDIAIVARTLLVLVHANAY